MILLALSLLVSQAEHEIASHSANPAAAQFESVHEGPGIVCGMVNLPNRAGGYDGFTMFLYASKDDWSIGMMDGLVMSKGKLTNLNFLHARTAPADAGYRRATEQDVADMDEFNAANDARDALLRACPKQLNSD